MKLPTGKRKAPDFLQSLFSKFGYNLYKLSESTGPETAGAYLDCCRSTLDKGLYCNKVRAENTLCGNADVLTYTTVLLSLTFTSNDITGDSSLTANITSSCHDYYPP